MTRSLALLSLALLCGCSSSSDVSFADYRKVLKLETQELLRPGSVLRAKAMAIREPTLGYRVNGGPESILVLSADTRGQQTWTAVKGVALATRGGRIVHTVGLLHDINIVPASAQDDPSPPAAALHGQTDTDRLMDFPDVGAYSVPVRCTAIVRGHRSVSIMARHIDTVLVDENCSAPSLKWSFTDSFWIDPKSERVWRARQNLNPRGDAVEIEILRPPG